MSKRRCDLFKNSHHRDSPSVLVSWSDKGKSSTAIEPKQLALLYEEDRDEGDEGDIKGEGKDG